MWHPVPSGWSSGRTEAGSLQTERCGSRASCVGAGCSLLDPPDPPGTAGGSASHLGQKHRLFNVVDVCVFKSGRPQHWSSFSSLHQCVLCPLTWMQYTQYSACLLCLFVNYSSDSLMTILRHCGLSWMRGSACTLLERKVLETRGKRTHPSTSTMYCCLLHTSYFSQRTAAS